MKRALALALIALPLAALAQDKQALDAIAAHPEVRKRVAEFRTRLVWMDWQGSPGLVCFALKEDTPTHVTQVDTFCLDRARQRVLRYDVVSDKYEDLPWR